MNSESLALIVNCWHDQQTNSFRLRLVKGNQVDELKIREGVFLLRISSTEVDKAFRCHIRHLKSGQEAYFQAGTKLQAFIKQCLLESDEV